MVKVEEILNQFYPEPPAPYLELHTQKNIHFLGIYKENLTIYIQALEQAKGRFKQFVTNSRSYNEKMEKAKELLEKVTQDIQSLREGKKILNTHLYKVSENPQPEVSSQIEKNLYLKESGHIRINYGSGMTGSVIRVSKANTFPLKSCPYCSDFEITNEKELFSHINESHLSAQQFKQDSQKRPNGAFKRLQNYTLKDISGDPNAGFLKSISVELEKLYKHNKQPDAVIEFQVEICKFLERTFQELYPDCSLHIYGSNNNGFGTKRSDMDLALLMDLKKYPLKNPEDYNHLLNIIGSETELKDTHERIVFSQLCEKLHEIEAENIDMRYSARVRIINFQTPKKVRKLIEIDLCINNQVAVYNTQLLKTYSLINERVPRLGVAVKIWAKARDIADPRNGSLSSYAYIILVIYYLQNTNPPILPNLQQNYTETLQVGEHNCTFNPNYSDFERFGQINQESLGELLFGFFKFYAFFDWETVSVDIRNKERCENNSSKSISIKDPFENNRDLGDVCFESMTKRIKLEFKRALHFMLKSQNFCKIIQ